MPKLIWIMVSALWTLSASILPAHAGEIVGEINFLKKAPTTGIVYLPAADKAPSTAEFIDQKDKQFTRNAFVAVPGQSLKIKNSDSLDHNIFANDIKIQVFFDVGLMSPGQDAKVDIAWDSEALIRIGCKIHPKMRSYVATVNSAHYQVLPFEKGNKQYPLSISGIPDSLTKVAVLLPRYDKVEVDLAVGETKTVDLMKKGKLRGSVTLTRN